MADLVRVTVRREDLAAAIDSHEGNVGTTSPTVVRLRRALAIVEKPTTGCPARHPAHRWGCTRTPGEHSDSAHGYGGVFWAEALGPDPTPED